MEKPRVYLTRKLPSQFVQQLRERVDLEVFGEADVPVPREELLQRVKGCEGILTMLTDRVDDELLSAAGSQLKVVANMAVGVDNIDLSAAARHHVTVTNTPDVLTETTADLVFALLLSTARRIPEADQFVRSGQWKTWSPLLLAGQDVFQRTLGIVGMGRIGQAVARRAAGFSMNILYHNRSRNEPAEARYGAVYTSLPALLESADFVVLLAPLTPDTIGLIGQPELDRMKPTAILINAGRGTLVDESALYQALINRKILAAGLDVYQTEPVSPGHPLLALPNVVLLPHIGSASVQTRHRMAQLAIDNLLAVLKGDKPISAVSARQQQ